MTTAVWITIVALVLPYGEGVRRLWRAAGTGRGIAWWRAGSFAAGAAILIATLSAPFDALADARFSVHMAEHLLMVAVIPPLVLLGSPEVAFAWTFRAVRWQRDRLPVAVRTGWLWATTPLVAWLAHTATLWLWHQPQWYQAALENAAVHAVEHLSLLGTAFLLWRCAIRPRGGRRAGAGIAVLLMLATAMQSGALGALLASSTRVWYPAQELTLGHAAALADQQLAGLLMWIPGGLLYALAGCVFFYTWIGARPRVAPMGTTSAEVAQ
ncbi:MAG TPA: cytochrome c oxidase assembly protein [Gemmatimonadales bacterium]|jgi:cytochrome c oxidase assembly factor CtaG